MPTHPTHIHNGPAPLGTVTATTIDTTSLTLTWWAITATVLLIAAAITLTVLTTRNRNRATSTSTSTSTAEQPRAQRVMYFVALLATAVSADTSWRFVGTKLGINGWEQIFMFAILEVAMIACGVVMRANVIRYGTPGPARTFLWLLAAAAALAAWQLSGLWTGLARVVLGPLVGIWALHIALGVDMRAARRVRTGTWQRITAEVRERLLSRLGLGDDTRDAVAMREERAARRAATLAHTLNTPGLGERRTRRTNARLVEAMRRSNAAHNPDRRNLMLAEFAALATVNDLLGLTHTSPWTTAPRTAAPAPAAGPVSAERPARPARAATNGTAVPALFDTATPTGTTNTDTATATPTSTSTSTAAPTSTSTSTAAPTSTSTSTAAPTSTDTDPGTGDTKVAAMVRVFRTHAENGTLKNLNGQRLADAVGASGTLGRRLFKRLMDEHVQATTTTTPGQDTP